MSYSVPTAKVIADSISPDGVRLTTIHAKIHRFVLAELNTHRVFSRNSASSRAIPTKKIRQMVVEDPAMPIWWGKNQAGMQANEELTGLELHRAHRIWLDLRDEAVSNHEEMEAIGLHKQIANRPLEPWLWHHVIISATEWDNFFHQRRHKDAQPEMRYAADAIFSAREASKPKLVGYGEWHLPYGDRFSIPGSSTQFLLSGFPPDVQLEMLKKICVGRCARVSYLTHDGVIDIAADIALFDRLSGQDPGHWSPLEHVATPVDWTKTGAVRGNFKGWRQLRHDYEKVS